MADGRAPRALPVSFGRLSYERARCRHREQLRCYAWSRVLRTGLNEEAHALQACALEFGAGGTVRDRLDALRLTDCITLSDWGGSTRTRRAT